MHWLVEVLALASHRRRVVRARNAGQGLPTSCRRRDIKVEIPQCDACGDPGALFPANARCGVLRLRLGHNRSDGRPGRRGGPRISTFGRQRPLSTRTRNSPLGTSKSAPAENARKISNMRLFALVHSGSGTVLPARPHSSYVVIPYRSRGYRTVQDARPSWPLEALKTWGTCCVIGLRPRWVACREGRDLRVCPCGATCNSPSTQPGAQHMMRHSRFA